MEQQNQPKEKEKDDKKPGIPTLRDAAQKPQLKIKGLKAGQSILERLKQFKKKDLAFILAGLGVLFMAPLAEHFLMSPDNGDGAFKEGWNVKPGAGGIGSGGSPFEPGAGGVAPGDLAGGGSDVITPLNVRDPSALIMGPGATAQPPAMSSNAGGAPAKESSDWKDALSQSAAHAASAATHAATPLPPLPQLSGGGLRGLGAVSGGGGASYSLPPISASNVPNHGGGGGSLGLAKATNGYQGAAARSLTNSGNMDQLKARAGQAGADFNRGGAAGSALQQAAATNMGSGSDFGGAGQGGGGMGADKAGGQSSSKDSKSEGESLAFLAAKENQEKAIDLHWKLIEKQAMLWPDLKQKMIEEMMMTPLKKGTEKIADMFGDFIGGKGSNLTCSYIKAGDTTIPVGAPSFTISKDKIAKVACGVGNDKDGSEWAPTGTPNVFQHCGTDGREIACLSSGVGAAAAGPDKAPPAPDSVGGQGSQAASDLGGMCNQIQSDMASRHWDSSAQKIIDPKTPQQTVDLINSYDAQRQAIAGLLSVNDALTGGGGASSCAGYPVKPIQTTGGDNNPVSRRLEVAASNLALAQDSVLNGMTQAVGQIKTVTGPLAGDKGQLDPAHQPLSQALTALDNALKTPASDIPTAQKAAVAAYGPAEKPLDNAVKVWNDDATQKPITALQNGKDLSGQDLKTKLDLIQAKLKETTAADSSGMLAQIDSALKNGKDGVQDEIGQIGNPAGGLNLTTQIQTQLGKIQTTRKAMGDYWQAISDANDAVNGKGSAQGSQAASLASVTKLCGAAQDDMTNTVPALQKFDQGGPNALANVAAASDEPIVAGQIQQLAGDGDKQAGLWPAASKATQTVDQNAAAATTAIKAQNDKIVTARNAVGGPAPVSGVAQNN